MLKTITTTATAGTDIRSNMDVLYCASRNPYDERPLEMKDAFRSQEEAFPDICIKSHWDPTLIANRYLLPPSQTSLLPTDFRPFTRICQSYYTTDRGTNLTGATTTPPLLGGRAGRDMDRASFVNAIDNESDLRGLPRQIAGKCDSGYYLPGSPSAMVALMEGALPESKVMTWEEQKILAEVNRPKAIINKEIDVCRDMEDKRNGDVSTRKFNNPTQFDRYKKAHDAARISGQSKPDRYLTNQ
jgi:hypothetical protein